MSTLPCGVRRGCRSTVLPLKFRDVLLSSRIVNEELTEQSVVQVRHFKAAGLAWNCVRVNEPEE